MKKEIIAFSGHKGAALRSIIWSPEDQPKAILQITHGMTEHIGRYESLARELTSHGIATAGFDLRGHGANPGDARCASMGKDGWEASLEDMHLFYAYLDQKFPDCPHFMLGFSLGSFLLREYLTRYTGNAAGAAILGTGQQPSAVLSIMAAIVKTQVRKAGFDGTTPLVKKLSFGAYNQTFTPNRTAADWLCADEAELDAYLADPLCRKDISAGLFLQLLESMKRTGNSSAYDAWNKDLPVLLLSGKHDPVGGSGKGVDQVMQSMTRAGLTDVAIHLFPGARHDLLHEEGSGCAEQVRSLLLDWLLQVLS